MTGQDFCYTAALEAGIVGIENPLQPAVATYILQKLNRILDNWNADRDAVLATDSLLDVNGNPLVLSPNTQPHTIGPGGTFDVAARPVSIEFANVVINTVSPAVTYPVTIHKSYGEWYASQAVQKLATQYPNDVYYAATFPLGKLYLWPVPTIAYQFQIWSRVVLAAATLASTLSFAPGYEDALILTMAEDLCATPAFGLSLPPGLALKAAQSRQRVFSNNRETPTLATRDSGMPGEQGGGYLNWRTGLMAR